MMGVTNSHTGPNLPMPRRRSGTVLNTIVLSTMNCDPPSCTNLNPVQFHPIYIGGRQQGVLKKKNLSLMQISMPLQTSKSTAELDRTIPTLGTPKQLTTIPQIIIN